MCSAQTAKMEPWVLRSVFLCIETLTLVLKFLAIKRYEYLAILVMAQDRWAVELQWEWNSPGYQLILDAHEAAVRRRLRL